MSERPAATDTTALREQRDILLFRQKEQIFFFFLRLCIPVCMPEGYTQYYEKDLS